MQSWFKWSFDEGTLPKITGTVSQVISFIAIKHRFDGQVIENWKHHDNIKFDPLLIQVIYSPVGMQKSSATEWLEQHILVRIMHICDLPSTPASKPDLKKFWWILYQKLPLVETLAFHKTQRIRDKQVTNQLSSKKISPESLTVHPWRFTMPHKWSWIVFQSYHFSGASCKTSGMYTDYASTPLPDHEGNSFTRPVLFRVSRTVN